MEHESRRLATATFSEVPREAVLTAAEVAEWLKIAGRQVQRLGSQPDLLRGSHRRP